MTGVMASPITRASWAVVMDDVSRACFALRKGSCFTKARSGPGSAVAGAPHRSAVMTAIVWNILFIIISLVARPALDSAGNSN
jgi:hypothetical protein